MFCTTSHSWQKPHIIGKVTCIVLCLVCNDSRRVLQCIWNEILTARCRNWQWIPGSLAELQMHDGILYAFCKIYVHDNHQLVPWNTSLYCISLSARVFFREPSCCGFVVTSCCTWHSISPHLMWSFCLNIVYTLVENKLVHASVYKIRTCNMLYATGTPFLGCMWKCYELSLYHVVVNLNC